MTSYDGEPVVVIEASQVEGAADDEETMKSKALMLYAHSVEKFIGDTKTDEGTLNFYKAYCQLEADPTEENFEEAEEAVTDVIKTAYLEFLETVLHHWMVLYGEDVDWVKKIKLTKEDPVYRYANLKSSDALQVAVLLNKEGLDVAGVVDGTVSATVPDNLADLYVIPMNKNDPASLISQRIKATGVENIPAPTKTAVKQLDKQVAGFLPRAFRGYSEEAAERVADLVGEPESEESADAVSSSETIAQCDIYSTLLTAATAIVALHMLPF
eukprot:GHVQ01004361.1.p1 GENE.GHVQ01004361.1~~GHVQ01004361.1.p1  ORF type:complete len:270 (+),score=49.88 GHVQ01004361.1:251-1060(+)